MGVDGASGVPCRGAPRPVPVRLPLAVCGGRAQRPQAMNGHLQNKQKTNGPSVSIAFVSPFYNSSVSFVSVFL